MDLTPLVCKHCGRSVVKGDQHHALTTIYRANQEPDGPFITNCIAPREQDRAINEDPRR